MGKPRQRQSTRVSVTTRKRRRSPQGTPTTQSQLTAQLLTSRQLLPQQLHDKVPFFEKYASALSSKGCISLALGCQNTGQMAVSRSHALELRMLPSAERPACLRAVQGGVG